MSVRLKLLEEQQRQEQLPSTSKPSTSNLKTSDITYIKTHDSFFLFLEYIFCFAFETVYDAWISGPYIKRRAEFIQKHKRTMYVGPRGHAKSAMYYAYLAWLVWRNKLDRKNIKIAYISFNADLAGDHVSKFKELMTKSGMFSEGLVDLDTTADTKAQYVWKEGSTDPKELPSIQIETYGIMGGLRGIHPKIIILDDPYQDDSKEQKLTLDPSTVKKINNVFRTKILPIPPFDGELHVIGTPQSHIDLWFLEDMKRSKESETLTFNILIEKAYTAYDENGTPTAALWPELYPLEQLMEQEKVMGESQFRQEYLCEPRTTTDSFFRPERIDDNIRFGREIGLKNYDFSVGEIKFDKDAYFGTRIYGGYDPGKAKHPGHFAVFAFQNGELRQLLSKWFDHWDYAYTTDDKPSQIKYIKDAAEYFEISKIWADNTNGVLTQSFERGDVPSLEESIITPKNRAAMARELEAVIGKPKLRLVDDDRQKEALLALTGDFRLLESRTNHGESFTTVGLVVKNIFGKIRSDSLTRIKIKYNKEILSKNKRYRGFF